MAAMTEAERKRWQQLADQAARERLEAIRDGGSKPVAPRTPAGGNLRRGSLTTLSRVR